ncbi:thioesterase II family protein [Segnochrobactrum spirostomi]|nr:alpha/beta fold hydrolase [Segnochrobactrum spirostomi]
MPPDHAPRDAASLVRWSRRPAPGRPSAVFFPHAGGSILSAARIAQALPAAIGFGAVALPGHDLDGGEALRRADILAARIADDLGDDLQRDGGRCHLVGNSFGALLAFEVARILSVRLGSDAAMKRLHLVVSGFRSPSLPPSDVPLHRLPRAHLVRELAERFGPLGTSAGGTDLDAMQEAALRADLEACETYRLPSPTALACNISVIDLRRDPSVSHEEKAAWQDVGAGPIEIVPLDADHFPWMSATFAFADVLLALMQTADHAGASS